MTFKSHIHTNIIHQKSYIIIIFTPIYPSAYDFVIDTDSNNIVHLHISNYFNKNKITDIPSLFTRELEWAPRKNKRTICTHREIYILPTVMSR